MLIIAFGLVFPRMMDEFVPAERRGEGEIPFSPNLAIASAELSIGQRLEVGEEADARSDILDTGSNKPEANAPRDGFATMGGGFEGAEKEQNASGGGVLHD